MALSDGEIDFQSILEQYEEQNAAIECTNDLVKEKQAKYKDLMAKLTQQKQELLEKKKLLNTFNFKRLELIEKLRESQEHNNIILDKTKIVQDQNQLLDIEIKKNSDEFLEKIKRNEIRLKNLDSEFTNEYLQDEINKCEKQQKEAKKKENFLMDDYNKLKANNSNQNIYKNMNLSQFIPVQENQTNVNELKRNIQESLIKTKMIKEKIQESIQLKETETLTTLKLNENHSQNHNLLMTLNEFN